MERTVSFVESECSPCTAPDFLPVSLLRAGCAARPRLHLHPRGDPQRAEVERVVTDVYRRHFGARLIHFMPMLATVQDGAAIRAAVGYRSAAEPLFLERYLPRPIEQLLAEVTGHPVERSRIVEVGQFASQRPGNGQVLMAALARHLADSGFRWAVITATVELRRLFSRLGLASLPLAAAQPQHLGAESRLWGSYYRHAPKVLAGELLPNVGRLERRRR
jgi:hypothetical protein